MVRAFERFVWRHELKHRDFIRQSAGIQPWTPKPRNLTADFCKTYVKHFFKCSGGNQSWMGNQFMSPFFDRCLSSLEKDILHASKTAKKTLRVKHRWPNITKEEQEVILRMRNMDVGYNLADKNYGAVVYSKEIFRKQCQLHLEDDKGTYWKIVDKSKEAVLDEVFLQLQKILLPFRLLGGGWKSIAKSIENDSLDMKNKGQLCKFYTILKLHKAANASGVMSRPIAAALNYVTGPASHFLHSQLKESVWKHSHVLKDSLELIRILEELELDPSKTCRLTTADVIALYPSIRLEQGMKALKWFLNHHTNFNQTLKDLCINLAFFVLSNNFVTCEEVGDAIYRQMIGTAMGTSFSVVYAIIFMIWLETPIINDPRFSRFIQVYKRFIDDLFLIWSGTPELLCDFRKALAEADEGIGFDWSGYKDQQDAVDPSLVAIQQHDQVNFLDLDIALSRKVTKTGNKVKVILRPYRKPGNSYAYIPFTSFHGRHTFRGWVLAEILRLLTHSSSIATWRAEGQAFYHCLISRGYPRWFLDRVFREVTWAQRSEILSRKRLKSCNEFFDTYKACVITVRNAPEWPDLVKLLDLSLHELRKSTFGDIFPKKVFLAQSSAPRLGSILKR